MWRALPTTFGLTLFVLHDGIVDAQTYIARVRWFSKIYAKHCNHKSSAEAWAENGKQDSLQVSYTRQDILLRSYCEAVTAL